jgi:hypothetical protein
MKSHCEWRPKHYENEFSFELGSTRNLEIVQKACTKNTGVWMYYGTIEITVYKPAVAVEDKFLSSPILSGNRIIN